MTAADLVLIVLAVLLCIGFTALIVVLLRVYDAIGEMRTAVTELRDETRPLLVELRDTADDARSTVEVARDDLERFDKVLGSAEAIGDAVSDRVARTAFSAPAIKAAAMARGASQAWKRLRGQPVERPDRLLDRGSGDNVIDVRDAGRQTMRRRRA